MYRVKCDDLTLYNPLSNELVLGSPTLNLEVNKVGSFSFSIYPNHPHFNDVEKMESIITVFQENKPIFKGRVYSDTVNFYKVKKVEVEGLLAYFNDSIVRQYSFTGGLTDYLEFLITQHNEQVSEHQRFKLGTVTVEDPNDYIVRESSNTPTTWAEIEEKLLKLLGGYIVIRYEEDGNYIDYIADYTDTSTQKIAFAINLLDLENVVTGDSLTTCIIPYGAKIEDIDTEDETETTEGEGADGGATEGTETEGQKTERYLDITSITGGIDYIEDEEAVAKYGRIHEVVRWEDVTDPHNLIIKARKYLSDRVRLQSTLTIKAVDLHLTDETIEAFKIGDYIEVYSIPHNIKETLLLTSYNIDLTNPSGFTFTLGLASSSYTDSQISTDRVNSDNVTRLDIVDKQLGDLTEITGRTTSETLAYINQTIEDSKEFTRTLLSEYSKTSDLEELNKRISLSFTQTNEDITLAFNTLIDRMTTENGELNRQLEEISKYIRFVDGNIILGEVGTDLTTKIANGRISFLYNDDIEVAYISDKKLYITNAEILTDIIIGNFGFIPRNNGNLSFKKVR